MALTTIGLMALLGCFTGFMAGLLGIGGGMIITPFLIMLIPSSLIQNRFQIFLHSSFLDAVSTTSGALAQFLAHFL